MASSASEELPSNGTVGSNVETDLESGKPMSIKDRIRAMNLASNSGSSVPSFGRESPILGNNPSSRINKIPPNQALSNVSPSPLLIGRSCVTPTNMEYGGFRSLDTTKQSNQQSGIFSDPGVGMDTHSAAKAIAMWRNKSGRSKQMSNVIEDDSVDDDSSECWNIFDLSSKNPGIEAKQKEEKKNMTVDSEQNYGFQERLDSKHEQRAFKNVRNFVPVTPSPTQTTAPRNSFQESSFIMPKLRPVRKVSSGKEVNIRTVESEDRNTKLSEGNPNDKTSLIEENRPPSQSPIGTPHVNFERGRLEEILPAPLNVVPLQKSTDIKRNPGHHDIKVDASRKNSGTPVRSKVSDRIKAFSSPANGPQIWTQRSVGLGNFSLPCQHHQRKCTTNKESAHEEDRSCDSSEKVPSQNNDDDSISVITPGNSTPARLGAQPPTPNSYNSETACSGMSSGDGAVAGSSSSQRRRQQNLYEHFDTPDVSVQDDNSTCASSAGSIMPGTIRNATLLQSKLESDKVKAARRSRKKNMKVPCVLVAAQKKANDSSISSHWGKYTKGNFQSMDIDNARKESSLKTVPPKETSVIKCPSAISQSQTRSEDEMSPKESKRERSRKESKDSLKLKSSPVTCNNKNNKDISQDENDQGIGKARVEHSTGGRVTSRMTQLDETMCKPKKDNCGSVPEDQILRAHESKSEITSNKHLSEKKTKMNNTLISRGRRSHSSTLQSDAVKKILDRRRRRKAIYKSEKMEAKGDKHEEKENVETKDENIKEDKKDGKLVRSEARVKNYLEKSVRNDLGKTKRQTNKRDVPKSSKDYALTARPTATSQGEEKMPLDEKHELSNLKNGKTRKSVNHNLQAPPSIIRSTSRPRGVNSTPTLSEASATIEKVFDSLPVCASSFLAASDSVETSKDSEFPHDEEPEPSIDHFLDMDISPIKAVDASKHDFEATSSYRTSPVPTEKNPRKGTSPKREHMDIKDVDVNDSTPKRMNKSGEKDLDRTASLIMTESESRSDSDSFVSQAFSLPLARIMTDQQRPMNCAHSDVLSSISMRLKFADKVNARRKSPESPDNKNEEEQLSNFKHICDVMSEASSERRSPSTVSVTSSGVTSLSSRANRVLAGRRGKMKIRKQDLSSKDAILATDLARKMLNCEQSMSRRVLSGNKRDVKAEGKASCGKVQNRSLDLSLDTCSQEIEDDNLSDKDEQSFSDGDLSQYLEISDRSDHSSRGAPSPLFNDSKSEEKGINTTSSEVKSEMYDAGSWIGNKLSEINMDKLASDIIDGASSAVSGMPLTCTNPSGHDLPFTCGIPDLNSSSISAVRISQLEDEDAPYDEAEVAIEVEYLSNNDLNGLPSKDEDSELMMRHSFDIGKLPETGESYFNVSLYKV